MSLIAMYVKKVWGKFDSLRTKYIKEARENNAAFMFQTLVREFQAAQSGLTKELPPMLSAKKGAPEDQTRCSEWGYRMTGNRIRHSLTFTAQTLYPEHQCKSHIHKFLSESLDIFSMRDVFYEFKDRLHRLQHSALQIKNVRNGQRVILQKMFTREKERIIAQLMI
jgi:hypothetical protein